MASVAITTLEIGNFKEPGSVVNEITIQVDAELKMKILQKKTNELENDTQSTCHSE